MSRLPNVLVALAVAAPVAAAPLGAQRSTADAWLDRVSVSVRYGELRPAGRSELYTLMDRAVTPGRSALRPRIAGGHVRVALGGGRRFGVLLGTESGERTVTSTNLFSPLPYLGETRMQTSLDLRAVRYVGAEWTALRWRGAGESDRARLVLGAGAGTASYRVRQWGEFVDAARRVSFLDDFQSAGRGSIAYGAAGVEVPVARWLALQGEVRRQFGSAPMNADYATFDRLDLGGTRLSAGVRLGR
jgi:hypothetical protein